MVTITANPNEVSYDVLQDGQLLLYTVTPVVVIEPVNPFTGKPCYAFYFHIDSPSKHVVCFTFVGLAFFPTYNGDMLQLVNEFVTSHGHKVLLTA